MPDVVHVEVGRVPPSAWDQADGMIARLAGKAARPVLFARVKIHVDAERDPDLDEAIDRLDVGGATFVFFRNAESGQGNVVYRRYDGHYGVVEPRTTG